ncbi:fimbria/pilus periplasmic chaperone [Pseudomonas sp. BCRC 81390]|uniref:fimbrial biogenesis chaperone n=1 Tax=Pseudomonas sp. BCRC 81390 TaxID=3054778 RepID=UPI002597FBD5|nr:fimbria/pilus periplasmic chaperone [Pseudomonas sp. BCRC 81390]MDM3887000.1 fimbria/pilus periplasmic chaperone [Pseudomonas sp. BCRC 81390]
MRLFSHAVRRGWLLAICLASPPLAANVIIANTRVVFPADQAEVTVKLSNVGSTPSLVQAWVDDGRAQVQELQVPFDVMPAMFRLDAGKGQSLRLFHGGDAMPADRESLYWLNVLEVPPKGSGNALQVAIRSRIKLLYRPAGLPGKAVDAHRRITWQLLREGPHWVLTASNPSPYVVNLARVTVEQASQAPLQLGPNHVLPFASTRFNVEHLAGQSPARLRYAFIDDYGAVRDRPQAVTVQLAN